MTRLFTDPIAQVVIRDIESANEWHWGSPKFPFLTSVSFSWSEQAINAFSIGVDIPYDLALGYLDLDSTPFKRNNIVKARIGYATGGWTDWEAGFLADGGKGLSIGANGLTGTLQVSWASPKVAGYSMSKDILSEAGYDGPKLIRAICEQLGMGSYVSEQAQGYLNSWKLISRPSIREERLEYFNGLEGKTLMGALSDLCERSNCVYRMGHYKGKRTILVYTDKEKTRGEAGDQDVIRRYVLRGILDESNNQYPCDDVSPQSDAMAWIDRTPTGAASGISGWSIDTETGEDVKQEVAPQEQEVAQDGYIENTEPQEIRFTPENTGELIADATKNDGKKAAYFSAPVPPSGADIFKSQVEQFGLQGDPGQKITMNTIGVPEEQTGNLFFLFGAGAIYNGSYYIEGLTHSWTPGNWQMSLQGFRRGSKTLAGKKQETAGGQMPK